MSPRAAQPALSEEISTVKLGDERLNRRAQRIIDRIGDKPKASFPDLFPEDAELEATYRFLNNPSVDLPKLVEPHVDLTSKRAAKVGRVLVVHDTTQFEFPGEKGREGLRPLRGRKGKPGFLAHFALAVADDGTRRPLGVLGVLPIVRKAPTAARKKMTERQRRTAADSEFRRWKALVNESEAKLQGQEAIHVMDREGDDYDLLANMAGRKFVIRLHHDRKVAADGEDAKISELLDGATVHCTREVRLSRRLKRTNSLSANKRHPARAARVATLELSSRAVELLKPRTRTDGELPETLRVNLVRVREVDAPGDAEPVDWVLLTSEPIETPEQVERIVDVYRCRWLIEEFFQALKTGCAYEARQLESKEALFAALGLMIPVAWRLLLLRAAEREAPESPATCVLTPTEIDVLREVARKPLSKNPTASEVLLAIARLGGFISNNGRPGWRILSRGYEKLLAYEIGWVAAKRSHRRSAKT